MARLQGAATNTMIYTHVARKGPAGVASPLDPWETSPRATSRQRWTPPDTWQGVAGVDAVVFRRGGRVGDVNPLAAL
jgi:hypothetical protein